MDIKEVLKKYWPYMLGAVAGLWFLMRDKGTTSGSNDAYYQYAAQAAAQNAQIAAATADANRQYELQMAALNLQEAEITGEYETAKFLAQTDSDLRVMLADRQLELEQYNTDAQLIATGWTLESQEEIAKTQTLAQMSVAQAQAGAAAISGYADIIDSLYAPGIAAVNAGAARDMAAIQAAADVAVASYYAQTEITTESFIAQNALTDSYFNLGAAAVTASGNAASKPIILPPDSGGSSASIGGTIGGTIGTAFGTYYGAPAMGGQLGASLGRNFLN